MNDGRQPRLWFYRALAILLGALAWAALPGGARADNCSGLTDCYGTVASGLAATVGIALVLATVVSLPSILSSLEALAARSLGLGDDAATADAATAAGPAGGDPAHSAPLADSGSLAKAAPGPLDRPGMPYEGTQSELQTRSAVAPPPYQPPPAPPPAFAESGATPDGSWQDLRQGFDAPPPPPPFGSESAPAPALDDLHRAAPPPLPGGETSYAAPPADLSRGPGDPSIAMPRQSTTPVNEATLPTADQNLGRGSFAGGDVTLPAAQFTPPGQPAVAGDIAAPTFGRDALAGGPELAPGGPAYADQDLTAGSQAVGGQDMTPSRHPLSTTDAESLARGDHGGAEIAPAAGQTDLSARHSAPMVGDEGSLARGSSTPASGNQLLDSAGDQRGEATATPATPTSSTMGPAPSDPRDLGRGPIAPGSPGLAPPSSGGAELGAGHLGSGGLGAGGASAASGDDLGAAVARQILEQAPALDHTGQLAAAAQGISGGVAGGAEAATASGELLRGLGLDAGAPLDLGGAIVIPAADGAQALRFVKATGAFEISPLDPVALAFLPAGAASALEPARGRTAFARYLRWAEAGAPRDTLDRDPDLAAIRAAGLNRVGQTRRADVERALGGGDQQWTAGNLFHGYRLAEWPDYLYIFEFDAVETLRSQGFVAAQSPPADAPLAIGMTRDAIWSRLGPPTATDGWWPFERWRYRAPDGHLAGYEFAHGILRRVIGGT